MCFTGFLLLLRFPWLPSCGAPFDAQGKALLRPYKFLLARP
jgi:hypothetical protein